MVTGHRRAHMLFAITQDLNMLRHKNNCGHCEFNQLLLLLLELVVWRRRRVVRTHWII